MDSTIKELNECFICWMEFKWIPPDPVTLTIHISEAKLYSIQMNPDLGCSIFRSPVHYQFFFRLFALKSWHKFSKPNFVFSVKNSQRFNDWAVAVPIGRDEDQDHVHRQQRTGRRREKQVNNNILVAYDCFFTETGPATTRRRDVILFAVWKVGPEATAVSFLGRGEWDSSIVLFFLIWCSS